MPAPIATGAYPSGAAGFGPPGPTGGDGFQSVGLFPVEQTPPQMDNAPGWCGLKKTRTAR